MEKGSDSSPKITVNDAVNDEKREKQLGFFSKSMADFIQIFNHYVLFRMPVFFISGLIYGHSLVKHAVLSVLIIYITEGWENPNLSKAAIILNAQEGLSSVLVVFEAHFADSSFVGRFYVVIFSTVSMIAGLMLLRELDPDKNFGILGGVIFLIALGEAGKEPTLKAFLADQLKAEDAKDHQSTDEEKANEANDQLSQDHMEHTEEITSQLEIIDSDQMQKKDNANVIPEEPSKMENLNVAIKESKNDDFVSVSGKSPEEKLLEYRVNTWWRMFRMLGALSGTFGLRKISWGETWRRTFLTTTLVMALSVLIFLSGFPLYKYAKPKHSPLKSVFRVLRSVFSNGRVKYSNQSVDDRKESDKVETIEKTSSPSSRKKERKQVSAEEVKEVKRLMRMIPMWATFIMYCVTQATGSTFFFEQMTDLDMTIGPSTSQYTVPPMIFYLMQSFSSLSIKFLVNYIIAFKWFQKDERKMIAYKIRIGLGLACSCLACVAAMFVEKERLKRVAKHLDSDKRAEVMNMTVFYLTPQFCLLGLAEGLTEDGLVDFFYYQVAESSKNHGPSFNQFALGLGKFFSIFWILTFSFSGWIKDKINNSRLDKYYMVLALVNFGNLFVIYTFVSIYVYKGVNGIQLSWDGFFETCFERSKTAGEGSRMSKLGAESERCGEGKCEKMNKPGDSTETKGGPPDNELKDCCCFSLCRCCFSLCPDN